MSSRQGYRALSEAQEHYDVEAPPGVLVEGSQVLPSAIPTATVAPSSPLAASSSTPSSSSPVPPPPSSSPTTTTTTNPAHFQYPIRILDTQGHEHSLDGDSPTSTIGALKLKVQTVSGVPPLQQRLIFAGRMLQDQQTLQSCNIQPSCVIHLFARPPPPPPGAPGSIASVVGTGAAGAGGGEGGVVIGPGTHLNPFGLPSSFGDPELIRSTHSVKLFSSCLVAICAMQLLLLSLQLLASWSMGGGTEGGGGGGGGTPIPGGNDDGGAEDKGVDGGGGEGGGAVFFLQVVMNTLGLYVGLVGIRSANTLQLQSTKVYLYGLLIVGTAWMASRIIWAINSVSSGYDVDVGPQPSSSSPSSPPSNGTDSGGGGGSEGGGGVEYQQMDRGELIYMVSLSCFLYSLVWGVCFLRASQFYNLVRRANGLGP